MSLAVSVLLPVRDAREHLPACIASLEGQTWTDFEVVAVDDASCDGSRALLDAWARRDPRVRVLEGPGRGLVAALEAGRVACRGRWLARMDADDIAAPERLRRQLALVERKPELTGCGSLVEYFPPGNVQGGARRYQRWLNGLVEPGAIERDMFVECPLAHPTFFLRADRVEAVGGYRDRGWPEDYDLILRLWAAGARFAKVPEVLLRWREGPGRLSRLAEAYSEDAFRRCKAHFLARTLLRERDGAVVWGSGPVGKAFALALKREGVTLRAFVDLSPRKIGQEIHGAPVVAPEDVDRFRGAFCVAAVGQPGARAEIRSALAAAGWRETKDFCAVA